MATLTYKRVQSLKKHMRLVFSYEIIQAKVQEIAEEISRRYEGQEVVLVGVYKGALYFQLDLMRRLQEIGDVLPIMDMTCVSRYGEEFVGGKEIQMRFDVAMPIKGRAVIVVDDIADEGKTLEYIRGHLQNKGPSYLDFVPLVVRKGSSFQATFPHLVAPRGRFLIGYGLDLLDTFRELPGIVYIPKKILKQEGLM